LTSCCKPLLNAREMSIDVIPNVTARVAILIILAETVFL